MSKDIINEYVDWFHTLTPENRLDIIKKINTKYDSDDYYYRETGMGYEPRKPLYDLLYEYAEKYGEKSDDVNGFFPEFKYVFDNVEVSLLIGQGSVIQVKIKE